MIAKHLLNKDDKSWQPISIIGLSCFVLPHFKLSEALQNMLSSFSIAPNIASDADLISLLTQKALMDAGLTDTKHILLIADCRQNNMSEQNIADNSYKATFLSVKGPLQALIGSGEFFDKSNEPIILVVIEEACVFACVLKRGSEDTMQRSYGSLVFAQEGNDLQSSLQSGYQTAGIDPQSLELLLIGGKSSGFLDEHLKSLASLFAGQKIIKSASCSLQKSNFSEQEANSCPSLLLLSAILSLQQKVLLEIEDKSQAAAPLPFYTNIAIRPWFHPQIHKQLVQLTPQLEDEARKFDLRRAAIHLVNDDKSFSHLIIEESADINESIRQSLQTNWDNELFTLAAAK